MVDTIKTKAQLQAALAGGVEDSITAQTMRDLLVTLLGDYAGLTISDTTPSTFTVNGLTDTLFDQFAVSMPSSSDVGAASSSPAADTLTVATDGVFLVQFQVSFGATAARYEWTVYANGSELATKIAASADTGGTSDVVTAAAAGIVALSAGDVLDLRVAASSSGSKSAEVPHAHLSAIRIG